MPRPSSQRSELSEDMDPLMDAIITGLLMRMGVRVPFLYSGVDRLTDMAEISQRIPPEFRADPRVSDFYAARKQDVKDTVSKVKKKKRKVSKYQKEFGRSMKTLIKKHPRTPRTRLMKRAHKLTRKVLK